MSASPAPVPAGGIVGGSTKETTSAVNMLDTKAVGTVSEELGFSLRTGFSEVKVVDTNTPLFSMTLGNVPLLITNDSSVADSPKSVDPGPAVPPVPVLQVNAPSPLEKEMDAPRALPCYFGGTIANRDSENYNGDRKATVICAMGGQLTLSMNITEARLNTFTQVEYTLDEYNQIDSVYPFIVIAKPTPDEIMEIGARTIIKGKIHSYLKSKDGGVKGTIVPTDPVYKQRQHLFLSKRLCRQFVEDDYPVGTSILFATAVLREGDLAGFELAVVVNIAKDPEILVENMENLIPFEAALALSYNSTVNIDCFLGEELGGSSSAPFCDFPVSKSPDLPFSAGEALPTIISKCINHYNFCAKHSPDENVRLQYQKKEKRMRTERLNYLINPYNYGESKSHLWWFKAATDLIANPANMVGRIFLLKRLDYETTESNLGDINDLSMYTDDSDHSTHLLTIHFSPSDMHFQKYCKDTKKITNGKSETHFKVCLLELTRAHLARPGPVISLELGDSHPNEDELLEHYSKEGREQVEPLDHITNPEECEWSNTWMVSHYNHQEAPLPKLANKFITRRSAENNPNLVQRYLPDLTPDRKKRYFEALTVSKITSYTVVDGQEWVSPVKPYVALVHYSADTHFPTLIRTRLAFRNDLEMGVMGGSGRVIRVTCKDKEEQSSIIKRAILADQLAVAGGNARPFKAWFTNYRELHFFAPPTRLPGRAHPGGSYSGSGHVFIQGIPTHIPDALKEQALILLGIPKPREADGLFIRCVGQENHLVRVFSQDLRAFYAGPSFIYDKVLKSFKVAESKGFQGTLVGPVAAPQGVDIAERRPLFRNELGEADLDAELKEVDPCAADKWVALNRAEAALLATLRSMEGLPEDEESIIMGPKGKGAGPAAAEEEGSKKGKQVEQKSNSTPSPSPKTTPVTSTKNPTNNYAKNSPSTSSRSSPATSPKGSNKGNRNPTPPNKQTTPSANNNGRDGKGLGRTRSSVSGKEENESPPSKVPKQGPQKSAGKPAGSPSNARGSMLPPISKPPSANSLFFSSPSSSSSGGTLNSGPSSSSCSDKSTSGRGGTSSGNGGGNNKGAGSSCSQNLGTTNTTKSTIHSSSSTLLSSSGSSSSSSGFNSINNTNTTNSSPSSIPYSPTGSLSSGNSNTSSSSNCSNTNSNRNNSNSNGTSNGSNSSSCSTNSTDTNSSSINNSANISNNNSGSNPFKGGTEKKTAPVKAATPNHAKNRQGIKEIFSKQTSDKPTLSEARKPKINSLRRLVQSPQPVGNRFSVLEQDLEDVGSETGDVKGNEDLVVPVGDPGANPATPSQE